MSASRPITEDDIEWRDRRFRLPKSKVDAETFIRQMRDEEWEVAPSPHKHPDGAVRFRAFQQAYGRLYSG